MSSEAPCHHSSLPDHRSVKDSPLKDMGQKCPGTCIQRNVLSFVLSIPGFCLWSLVPMEAFIMFSHLSRAALFVGGILESHGYAHPTHHGTHFSEQIQALLQERDIISVLLSYLSWRGNCLCFETYLPWAFFPFPPCLECAACLSPKQMVDRAAKHCLPPPPTHFVDPHMRPQAAWEEAASCTGGRFMFSPRQGPECRFYSGENRSLKRSVSTASVLSRPSGWCPGVLGCSQCGP